MPADDAVSELKGVGETTEAKLAELGVTTVGELAGLESEEHASLVEKAQAYLSEPQDEEGAEDAAEDDAEDAEEEEPDALVKARIHAGKPETKAYLEELLGHEVMDYKRYTVEIPREDLDELLETAGQPHVIPLS